MKRSIIATLIALSTVPAFAATQYDQLQDIEIHAARDQADHAQYNSQVNRNDIATLKGQTAGQIAANAAAIQQVNQQQAAVNQAQGTLINNNTANITALSKDVAANAQGIGVLSRTVGQTAMTAQANSTAIQTVASQTKQAQQTALKAGALASVADQKSGAALQGVATNGAQIQQLQKAQGSFVTKPEYQTDKAAQNVRDTKQDILIQSNSTAISTETAERSAADTAQGKLISAAQSTADTAQSAADRAQQTADRKVEQSAYDADKSAQAATDAHQDQALTSETAARKAGDQDLDARKMDKTTFQQAQQQNAQQVAAQQNVNAQHSQQIRSNTQRIERNEKAIQRNAQDIKNVRRELHQVANNAAAQASLHFNGNRDSWALSTGSAGDGAAFAAGIQKQVSDHIAVTFQASAGTDGGYMVGAGIHGDY